MCLRQFNVWKLPIHDYIFVKELHKTGDVQVLWNTSCHLVGGDLGGQEDVSLAWDEHMYVIHWASRTIKVQYGS